MKGLLAVFAVVSAVILLYGCVSEQANGNPAASNGGQAAPIANNGNQNAPATADKIIFTAPLQLEGEVGVPYEYSFCNPAPSGKSGLCGGIDPTTNPSGGKGPYSFYFGSGVGFQPFGLSLNLNGILSGTPAAEGSRSFQVCAKDIGGDFACQPVSLNIKPSAGLAGTWDMKINVVMNGPEGSFPPGCSMKEKTQLDLTQNGNIVGGTATNWSAKTTGCGDSSVDVTEDPSSVPVSGTLSAPNIKFTIGYGDFTGIISGGNMSGKLVTCQSPDPRCTCAAPDPRCPELNTYTFNWWTGDFTAIRVG